MKTDELMKIVLSYIESSKRDVDEMAAFLVPYIITSQEHEIRADERERCVAKAGERKLIHILNEMPARSDEINWFNAGIDTVIEAIKAE